MRARLLVTVAGLCACAGLAAAAARGWRLPAVSLAAPQASAHEPRAALDRPRSERKQPPIAPAAPADTGLGAVAGDVEGPARACPDLEALLGERAKELEGHGLDLAEWYVGCTAEAAELDAHCLEHLRAVGADGARDARQRLGALALLKHAPARHPALEPAARELLWSLLEAGEAGARVQGVAAGCLATLGSEADHERMIAAVDRRELALPALVGLRSAPSGPAVIQGLARRLLVTPDPRLLDVLGALCSGREAASQPVEGLAAELLVASLERTPAMPSVNVQQALERLAPADLEQHWAMQLERPELDDACLVRIASSLARRDAQAARGMLEQVLAGKPEATRLRVACAVQRAEALIAPELPALAAPGDPAIGGAARLENAP